ncbi:MAG TPA: crotonase/enoyl-CoA hydratase family protein [Allosphingosinicella sp.]
MKIGTEREAEVLIVTIDRPECRNAIDSEAASMLREAFEQFERDESASVAVLTGAGGTFCSGWDLKSLAGGEPDYDPEGPGALGPTRTLPGKPVIAAVEGHAVAGGLELALWCDLRIASETAIFGVYCRRWGVPLIDGGTVRLPRLVGQGRALDMILTGRPVGAQEALNWGLADRLVPAGRALETAVSLAQEIARFPASCMRADRMSAYRQWDLSLEEALREEARGGEAPLRQGARDGAARFAGGLGRAGRFDEI